MTPTRIWPDLRRKRESWVNRAHPRIGAHQSGLTYNKICPEKFEIQHFHEHASLENSSRYAYAWPVFLLNITDIVSQSEHM